MVERLLARLARALDAAGVRYMIIGGQATIFYGEPRLTQDVDIVLGLSPHRADELVPLADAMGLEPREGAIGLARSSFVYPCTDVETGAGVDLILSSSAYENLAIGRSETVSVGDVPVRFVSLEDLVILKVVAGRAIDHLDVRNVLLKNPGIDVDYVLHWLEQLEGVVESPLMDTFRRLYRETRP